MPLFRPISSSPTCKVGLWHITENQDDLINRSIELGYSIAELSGFRNEQKRKQWLAARVLLAKMRPGSKEILYDKAGAPFLQNGTYISMSHSHEFVSVILDERNEAGIDIQHFSAKTGHIMNKFCSDDELTGFSESELFVRLHIIWAAKEAVYKKMKIPGLIFREQILTGKFQLAGNGLIEATVRSGEYLNKVTLSYEILGDYALAFTMNP